MENKKDIAKLIIVIVIVTTTLAYLMTIPKVIKIIDDLAALWLLYMILSYFYNEMIGKDDPV